MTITDIYRLLFGREGTSKGTDIDMAEHGRAGGVSTGTPFKGVQEIPNKFIMDETDGSAIYIGEANHGSLTSAEVWRICKIVKTAAVTTIYYASGTDKFDKEWDERDGYTYS